MLSLPSHVAVNCATVPAQWHAATTNVSCDGSFVGCVPRVPPPYLPQLSVVTQVAAASKESAGIVIPPAAASIKIRVVPLLVLLTPGMALRVIVSGNYTTYCIPKAPHWYVLLCSQPFLAVVPTMYCLTDNGVSVQGCEWLVLSVTHVACHMSHVTCHMSHVACHMSHVACHMSHVALGPTL